MSSEPAIRVSGLSKCYRIYDHARDRMLAGVEFRARRLFGLSARPRHRDFWALRDVNFDVSPGEAVGIVGRNGSGKSTLLQLIAGTLEPTEGSSTVSGRVGALLELGSGFNPEFTGRENIFQNGAVLGMSRQEMIQLEAAIIAFAEIDDFIDQPIKTYSSGMLMRLAFAVQAQLAPKVLIVDEALSVGDARFQNKCLRRIEELRSGGTAILFVSHSASAVEALCDRAVWLDRGQARAIGRSAQVVRAYMNDLIHGDGVHTRLPEVRAVEDGNTQTNSLAPMPVPIGQQTLNERASVRCSVSTIWVRFGSEEMVSSVPCAPMQITLRVGIRLEGVVPRPLFGVGIFNNLNEPIVHFNSQNVSAELPRNLRAGEHIFEVSWESPALKQGEYLVSIGLDDGEEGSSEILVHAYGVWHIAVRPPSNGRPQSGYVRTMRATMEVK
jgi:lipopolysaccharide transport system ATP-binding protein